jgi:hypothetical protein
MPNAKSLADLQPLRRGWYTVTFHAPTRTMRIFARGKQWHMFVPLVSACDQPGKRDDHLDLSDFKLLRRGVSLILTFTEKSALWERKLYTIAFGPRNIRYSYKVFGRGQVERACFFRSWFQDPADTVEDEMGVVPGYDQVFSPAVNFMGKDYHFPGDTSTITVGNDPMYWGSGLVAAPYCFATSDRGDKDTWVWAGLGVREGGHTFDEFTYNSNVTKRIYGAGGFDCNYHGRLSIDGSWESPTMILGMAKDPYRALQDYVGLVFKEYGPKLPKKKTPIWWQSPIFCGWGEQMSLHYKEQHNLGGGDSNRYCTQALHDEWLEIFRKHRIRPGQIIIDAGWSKPRGDMYVDPERWPDLRGWIDARHQEGIRIILWINAWDRDGVPDDECITRAGKPVAADPTNPRYEERLRAMIRRLLSAAPGCYNADGVKIDGEMNIPTGSGPGADLANHGNLWGLELQRRYHQIVHEEAHQWKPDAAVGTFQANPYLAPWSDTVRTADMFSIKSSPRDTMFHRARILSIAQPGCPIDTDHSFWYDQRDNWIDIMGDQHKCGVPCLYHARYVWHKRPFVRPYIEEMTPAHYAAIRRAFAAQWRRIGGRKGSPR